MGVWIGLDFGEKRVGVAVTDEEKRMAFPLKTLEFRGRNDLLAQIKKIIADYRAEQIVVGLPKTLKGDMGPAARKIMDEVEWFKSQVPGPWVLWDERLSTKEVERVLQEAELSPSRRKEVRDRLAAQRILQNYLDYQTNTAG